MSASSDMWNRGYYARVIKNRTETLLEEWYETPGPGIRRLIAVMRAGGWPLGEDTPESEERMRIILGGGDVRYGQDVDPGGSFSFEASSGDAYTYEVRAGYRPGYNPDTGRMEATV